MSRLSKIIRFFKAARRGEHLGDIAILKADAFGAKVPEGVEGRLEDVRGFLPEIDLAAMRAMPEGSLGHAFAAQLDNNGLKPFTLSPELRQEVANHTYITRYMATHDIIHVLTGFDTSYAGEMGVLAVTVEQGFAPGGSFQEWMARVFYPLVAPSQARATRHNREVGHRIGAAANFLLGVRYEERFAEPLSALRRELNIPDPQEAGVMSVSGGQLPMPAP